MPVDWKHKAREFSIKTCKPMRDYVLVRCDKVKAKTEGGLYIPEIAMGKASTGTVIKVGLPSINELSGIEIPIPLEVGDRIIFSKFSGQEILFKEDDYDYKLVPSKVIMGFDEEHRKKVEK